MDHYQKIGNLHHGFADQLTKTKKSKMDTVDPGSKDDENNNPFCNMSVIIKNGDNSWRKSRKMCHVPKEQIILDDGRLQWVRYYLFEGSYDVTSSLLVSLGSHVLFSSAFCRGMRHELVDAGSGNTKL